MSGIDPECFNLGKVISDLLNFRKRKGLGKVPQAKKSLMSISIEASELMEHFQWREIEAAGEIITDRIRLEKIQDEIADAQIYLLYLAADLKVDLLSAVSLI